MTQRFSEQSRDWLTALPDTAFMTWPRFKRLAMAHIGQAEFETPLDQSWVTAYIAEIKRRFNRGLNAHLTNSRAMDEPNGA